MAATEGQKRRSKRYYDSHKILSQKQRLTDEQITTIRRLYAEGRSQNQLARDFGVSQTYISGIVRGTHRRPEDAPLPHEMTRGEIEARYPAHAARIFRHMIGKRVRIVPARGYFSRDEVEKLVTIFRTIDDGTLLTTTEAACIIGVTRVRVSQYVCEGRFTICSFGRWSYLYREEVLCAKQQREQGEKVNPERIQNPLPSYP